MLLTSTNFGKVSRSHSAPLPPVLGDQDLAASAQGEALSGAPVASHAFWLPAVQDEL